MANPIAVQDRLGKSCRGREIAASLARHPTPEEKYKKRKGELEAILAKHPKCLWARNELKYLTADDFEEPRYRRPLAMDQGHRGVCDAAVAADVRYHGTFID